VTTWSGTGGEAVVVVVVGVGSGMARSWRFGRFGAMGPWLHVSG
jgi:hypothetical protein